jgi:hypothetical protein
MAKEKYSELLHEKDIGSFSLRCANMKAMAALALPQSLSPEIWTSVLTVQDQDYGAAQMMCRQILKNILILQLLAVASEE